VETVLQDDSKTYVPFLLVCTTVRLGFFFFYKNEL